jgi:hypothetical protein
MAAEIRAEPELTATAEPTVIWTPGSNPAQWALLQCPVFAPQPQLHGTDMGSGGAGAADQGPVRASYGPP